jgi:hypothetical protein
MKKSCRGFYQGKPLAAADQDANERFLQQRDRTASPDALPG